MGLISLHRKYSFVDYQHHLCSVASIITFLGLLSTIVIPIIGIYKLSTSLNYFVVYEQPNVKFQYKYYLMAENSMENGKVIVCSSFDFLNQLNETDACAKIRVTETDDNYDGITDELTITTQLHTFHKYGIKSLSLVLFLDTRLYSQCDFRIPSIVIIDQHYSSVFNDRKIEFNGRIEPVQNHGLVCPFFIRNVKSHFFFENLNENQTNFEEFEISAIRERLEHNPMFMNFQMTSTDHSKVNFEDTTIQVRLRVPEVPVRYIKSFWQKLFDSWIHFLSLFVISFTIINFVLSYIFENRWIMARRKNYVKDKEF